MPYASVPSSYESHRDILASDNYVIATYTLDQNYVTEVTLADGTTRKILYEGQVLQVKDGGKVVPSAPSTYPADHVAVGVLLQMADAHEADVVVPVVWRGDVIEDYCTDDGTFGTVAAATKTALTDRIQFVQEIRL